MMFTACTLPCSEFWSYVKIVGIQNIKLLNLLEGIETWSDLERGIVISLPTEMERGEVFEEFSA